jgi:hypothetical protein
MLQKFFFLRFVTMEMSTVRHENSILALFTEFQDFLTSLDDATHTNSFRSSRNSFVSAALMESITLGEKPRHTKTV